MYSNVPSDRDTVILPPREQIARINKSIYIEVENFQKNYVERAYKCPFF